MLGDAFAQCATRRGKGLELIPIDRESLLKDIAAQKRGNADTASTEVQPSLLEEEMENRQAMERLTKEHSVVVNEDIASQSTPIRNAPAFVSIWTLLRQVCLLKMLWVPQLPRLCLINPLQALIPLLLQRMIYFKTR